MFYKLTNQLQLRWPTAAALFLLLRANFNAIHPISMFLGTGTGSNSMKVHRMLPHLTGSMKFVLGGHHLEERLPLMLNTVGSNINGLPDPENTIFEL